MNNTCEEKRRIILFTNIFDKLSTEFTWLNVQTKIFKQLFVQYEDRIPVMNKVAPTYFRITMESLRDVIFLAICRLTDKKKVSGKETLSIRRLPDLLEGLIEEDELKKIVNNINQIVSMAEPFRDWRNRRIAHNDLPYKLKNDETPLAGIDQEMVDKLIGDLGRLLNSIEGLFGDSVTLHEAVVFTGDGNTIFSMILDGEKYRDQELDKWRGLMK